MTPNLASYRWINLHCMYLSGIRYEIYWAKIDRYRLKVVIPYLKDMSFYVWNIWTSSCLNGPKF